MVESQTVLVTGGAGFIGSHCIYELLQSGYKVVAIDNFVNAISDPNEKAVSLQRVEQLTGKKIPFHCVDVTNKQKLRELFKKYDFHCVMHMAALKAVGESIRQPLKYYSTNLIGSLNLLDVMSENNIKKIVFCSSATVYGPPKYLPLTEEHATGEGITNPHGETKYMTERFLSDICRADPEWSVVVLRYFNPVGAHPSGRIGENPKGVPNNLMPFVTQVAAGKFPCVKVFGTDYDTKDGTGVRDYIHIVDLAKGHAAALRKLDEENLGFKAYNLGTGCGYSVLEIIQAYEKVSGIKIPYTLEARRPGDVAVLCCDPLMAEKELGWKAELGLEDMCRDLCNWQRQNPDGYKSVLADEWSNRY